LLHLKITGDHSKGSGRRLLESVAIKIINEIKRRNVVRVLAAYLVGAWLIAQVADLVLPNFGAPAWAVPVTIRLLALGFPVAVVFAWAFQVTSAGIRRHDDIDYASSAVRSGAKRLDIATLIGVVIVVVIIGTQQVRRFASETAVILSSALPSIAVLAFENMSPDPSNAFFAEGISEEILNVLARIKGMRVASRTSAFSFAGRDTPVFEIGDLLGVDHVLEGSVRKQGNKVRITAQLIEAGTDRHLWSKTYDRELIDIFDVQEDIALTISEALMGALGMRQVIVNAPTEDLEAYELFLLGRTQFFARSKETLSDVIATFESVVERDPEFAEAWSFLAASYAVSREYDYFDEEELERRTRKAADAAARALALDLGQAMAVAIQGQVLGVDQKLRALELADQAARMAPEDAGLQMWAGNLRLITGAYVNESVPLLQKAYSLDPLVGINNGMLGSAYLAAGQRELGRQHIRRATELGWPHANSLLVLDMLRTGQREAAAKEVLKRFPSDRSTWDEFMRGDFSVEERIVRGAMTVEQLAAIEEQVEASGSQLFLVPHYLMLGDIERVFDEAESVPEFSDLFFRLAYSPSGKAVVEHPRFIEIGEEFGLMPIWLVKGYPMGCSRVQDDTGDHLLCPSWPE
jgi:adenylate cyclase